MVTYAADVLALGIYMGIVFMTCVVVILTTIYVLKRGLGKAKPWKRRQYKPRRKNQAVTEPVNQPVLAPVSPPLSEKDAAAQVPAPAPPEPPPANQPIFAPVSPPLSEKDAAAQVPAPATPEPVRAVHPVEGKHIAASSPDVSGQQSETAAPPERNKRADPADNKAAPLKGAPQYSKSKQEETVKLKVNNIVRAQILKSPASPQGPTRAGTTRPEQLEAVKAEPVPPKPATLETELKEMPPKQSEDKMSVSDLSDMFSQEIAEESESAKLAGSLNEVDILNLAGEAQKLLSQFKKYNSGDST